MVYVIHDIVAMKSNVCSGLVIMSYQSTKHDAAEKRTSLKLLNFSSHNDHQLSYDNNRQIS